MLPHVHKLIEPILNKLFEPETRRIDAMVSELNRKNSEIKGTTYPGFYHMGIRYTPGYHTTLGKDCHLPTLAFQLLEEANRLNIEKTKLELDRSQIKQVLFHLLHQCNDMQEVRDSLPECVVSLFPKLNAMPRKIIDPTHLILNNKFAMRAYNKMLPKIEMYSVMGLMY